MPEKPVEIFAVCHVDEVARRGAEDGLDRPENDETPQITITPD